MDPSLRVVTRIPLEALWTDWGALAARRVRTLRTEDVRELLRSGPVQFVVADCGRALVWVSQADCYAGWKHDVRLHLVDAPASGFHLEDYAGQYAYVASEWHADEPAQGPMLLLEKQH